MKISVTVEVEAPDDATHYSGDLLDEPTWYKCKDIADYPHWFYWRRGSGWVLSHHGTTPPHHSKPIPKEPIE